MSALVILLAIRADPSPEPPPARETRDQLKARLIRLPVYLSDVVGKLRR